MDKISGYLIEGEIYVKASDLIEYLNGCERTIRNALTQPNERLEFGAMAIASLRSNLSQIIILMKPI